MMRGYAPVPLPVPATGPTHFHMSLVQVWGLIFTETEGTNQGTTMCWFHARIGDSVKERGTKLRGHAKGLMGTDNYFK